MNDAIRSIVEAATRAPSGENCQPWHFTIRGNVIEQRLLPERDPSLYSWGQRASYMANGAALENLVLAAGKAGYSADVAYFPSKDVYHVATITLTKGGTLDPLVESIDARTTNRKPYTKRALRAEEREALLEATGNGNNLVLIEARSAIDELGAIGALNEKIMLKNPFLHKFFFSHVNWTKEEDEKKSIGFFIPTLELPPPAQAMFKLLSRPAIARALCSIGIHKLVAKQNGAVNASASAIGAILADAIEPIDFVRAGRTLERVWLAAAAAGLSFQPLTGVLFFDLMVQHAGAPEFTAVEKRTIEEAYQRIASIVKAGERRVVFMFRIGEGGNPTARATRLPLKTSAEFLV